MPCVYIIRGTSLQNGQCYAPLLAGCQVPARVITLSGGTMCNLSLEWHWCTGIYTLETEYGILRSLAIQPIVTLTGSLTLAEVTLDTYVIRPDGSATKLTGLHLEQVTAPIAALQVEEGDLVPINNSFLCASTDSPCNPNH